MQYSDELQTIIGQLDVFDGLDGQKLTVTTAAGDEYLITSKKWIKRLNKYADENIDISFEGTIEHDPEEGMDVINIKTFKPTEEVADDLPTLLSIDEDMKLAKEKGGGKLRKLQKDEIDDEDIPHDDLEVEGEDDDIEPSPDELEDEDIDLDNLDLDDLDDDSPADDSNSGK